MNSSALPPADWLQLEAYADGHLEAAARPALEARLATEPELRTALATHRTLVTGVRLSGRAALRQRLQRLEVELATQHPTADPAPIAPTTSAASAAGVAPVMRVSWSRRWGKLAAAAALVLASGLGTWAWWQHNSPQTLADRYGVPDPGLPVLMSAPGPNRRAAMQVAMNAYKLGDPAAALQAWGTLPADAIGADTALYYRGIFQLKLRENAAAAAAMEQLRTLPTTAFRERADYYFALALWAQGRTPEARAAFERLAAHPGHPFRTEAQLALEKLP